MTNNNLSKKKFKEFLSRNKNMVKVKDNRQLFVLNGEKWCFSLSDKIPQCRQFYEDCKGFITLMNGRYYAVRVDNPANYTWSRTTKNGIKAYSVIVDKSQLRKFECY